MCIYAPNFFPLGLSASGESLKTHHPAQNPSTCTSLPLNPQVKLQITDQFCCLVTLLPCYLNCYPVTLLRIPCYPVTLLPCYPITLLPCYLVTMLPCYSVTLLLLPCYYVTLLLCYHVTLLPCYVVTMLRSE